MVRRRRTLLGTVLVLLLVATTFAPARHLIDDNARTYLSTDGWPRYGQGAYVVGDDQPAVSPHEQPVPIASLAKVMTAYLVLEHYPLRAGDSGRRFAVGPEDVADTDVRRRESQSVVTVSAGEELTERDALMAILLPSANNVAVLVARQVSGSVGAFVAEMNRTARALGMSHTTYTDPSGYDDRTVSTALDQLRLAQVVAKDQTLASMMATRTYSLPVAGEVTNTNALLGHDGFVGMKTGSDEAAGGCLMFRSVRRTESGNVTVIGVVLGQPGHNLIHAGLDAARQLVDRVTASAASPSESAIADARQLRAVGREAGDDRPELIATRFVGQAVVRIEALVSAVDVERLAVPGSHLEEAEYRQPGLLCESGAGAPAGADERHGEVSEHRRDLAGRARCPIDRVLQEPRDPPVVLGRRDQQPVRGTQRLLQFGHPGRRTVALQDVLVEQRERADRREVAEINLNIGGRERRGLVEQRAVPRALAEASAQCQDPDRSVQFSAPTAPAM
jgi:serine-type D-Ala-D-Ala carboxypeptidase (penicillin-binding protein 5/6)